MKDPPGAGTGFEKHRGRMATMRIIITAIEAVFTSLHLQEAPRRAG
jgi:hypothetical protein